jgi:5'-nucleotidase
MKFGWIFSIFVGFTIATETIEAASIQKRSAELFPLSIVHLNDFHSKFEETNWQSTACKETFGQICVGGFARTLTTVKQLLKDNSDKNPIYLNIGDNFVGTLWYELFGWNVTSLFLNMISADATVCLISFQ